MRVTLIGAGGMLATALTSALRGEQLTELTEFECDITKPEQVDRLVPATRPEVIINAAAFTNVDRCETEEPLATKVNGEAVGTLARTSKKLGAIFVHISTDYVFDGKKAGGYVESDQPNPLSAYGRSKALGEKLLLASGTSFYLVRTSWLYGHGGKNFVDTMLELGEKRPSLEVVNDQHGSPTLTDDLAAAIHSLLRDRPSPGIYHRTNDGTTTWYDFARAIFQLSNLSVDVRPQHSEQLNRPAPRPTYSTLQSTKLPPLRRWEEALQDYLLTRSII